MSDDLRCSYREVDRSPADQLGLVLLPNADDVVGWSASGCQTDSVAWDELDDPQIPNDGDGTCRQGATNGNRIGVALQNPTWTDPPDIDDFAVVSAVDARKVASQAASIAVDVKVGASSYHNGATQSTTTSYVRYSRTDNMNPISGAEWTVADVDNLIAAGRCVDCSPNNRATKIQATVDAMYNAEYALEVRFAWSAVPVYGSWSLAVECQRLNPGSESVLVQVGQGGNPPVRWKTAYTCNADTDQAFNTYMLTKGELSGGAPIVRVWDNQSDTPDDTTQGTISLDVLRIDWTPPAAAPTPPPPPTPTTTAYSTPRANLRVRNLRAQRETVGVGQVVNFDVTAENVGFRLAHRVNLTLYDNVVSNATRIAWTELDLWDFEASATLSWAPPSIAAHTVIAFVDANYSHAETNESDNTRSVIVQVISGSSPGVPDLTTNEGDIGVESQPQAGQPTTLKVRVRNAGDASASNVAMRVQDNGATIDSYTVPVLAANAADVRTITWIPNGEGLHFINVTAEEGGVIRELREDNNVASMGTDVGPFPPPPCFQNKGEYVIPAGQEHVYYACWVFATNVTVYGKLRLLDGSTLVVGRWYPLPIPWPYPVPIPFPGQAYHSVRVEAGGLLEFVSSRLRAASATYAYGFEAKVGSAFYMNSSSAYNPWGRWPLALAVGGNGLGEIPGGFIVRTASFAFRSSTVAFGRLHGLFLEAITVPSPGLQTDTFQDNRGAGLVGLNATSMTVASSQFLRNRIGMYQRGWPWSTTSQATVLSSTFRWNVVGIESHKRSFLNLTSNSLVRDNQWVGVRLVWEAGSAYRTDPITASTFGYTPFDIYAYRASPDVAGNTFATDSAAFNLTHVVLDTSPYVTGGGLEWPRAVNNLFNSWTYDYRFLYIGVSAYSSNLTLKTNQGRAHQTFWCIRSTCRVDNNQILGTFWAVAAADSSTLTMRNNTVTHVGGTIRGAFVRDSTASIQDNNFSCNNDVAIDISGSGNLAFLRNKVVGVSQVLYSNGALFQDNNFTRELPCAANAPVFLYWSATVTFRLNRMFSDSGVWLTGCQNALVERNTMESPFYYPPGSPPTGNPRDRGHVAVYENTVATVRNNTMRYGSWGVSVDDSDAAQAAYALVRDNTVLYTGTVGIGVNRWSRGDVLHNVVNRSSGWALQVGSSVGGNRVEANWANDTHGGNGDTCDGTTIWLGNAYGPNGVVVSWNRVLRTNGTGMRVCSLWVQQADIYAHNNTFDNQARWIEGGITLHGGTAKLIRLENNTVSGYQMGIYAKAVVPSHDIHRNTLTNNKDGIRVGWGDVANGYAWAEFHDNVITGNVDAGVNVSAANWSPVEGPYPDVYPGQAVLRRNQITSNTYGVLVRVFIKTYDVAILPPSVDVRDNNTITGNTYGVYVKGGYLPSGTLYPVWADVHDNNTVASNTYGLWIDAGTTDLTKFRAWWNDVRLNANQGVHVEGTLPGPTYFNARCNWWNHALGPDDDTDPFTGPPDQNDNNLGQDVSDYFWYRELNPPPPPYVPKGWLNRTSSDPLAACNGGV